ncbi:MAG TPA: YafY family protein [Rhodothermales bacterium]|nr:YafY family protein [Rhodothermales bacterium]
MANAERVLNRTERLFALVLLLQNKPNLSSRDLARHFGVSRRTIFRDLRALAESGVPLTYAEGGGYEILEGYQLPPLMLSAREAATLLIGAEFVKLQPDPSLRKDADQVALKIAQVLPDEVRAYVERLRDATVLDPYWLHTSEPATDEQGRWYELSEAVARQRAVMMDYYVASRDEVTRRKVDPLGLVYYSDHWNLIAHDHLRGEIRNFRLEEIRWMRVLTETFRRPEGFDLAKHLEERGATRTQERVVLRFTPQAYRWARRGIPARIEEEREVDDRTEVTFYFENLDYIARWLLRYGTQVEVVAPEALRTLMRDEARAMALQYEA